MTFPRKHYPLGVWYECVVRAYVLIEAIRLRGTLCVIGNSITNIPPKTRCYSIELRVSVNSKWTKRKNTIE